MKSECQYWLLCIKIFIMKRALHFTRESNENNGRRIINNVKGEIVKWMEKRFIFLLIIWCNEEENLWIKIVNQKAWFIFCKNARLVNIFLRSNFHCAKIKKFITKYFNLSQQCHLKEVKFFSQFWVFFATWETQYLDRIWKLSN